MATDITEIQLTDAEKRLVAEIAERTGRLWSEVIDAALRQYGRGACDSSLNGTATESWYDRLARHGFVGCMQGGPPDLSTNPAHMEGFGESDH